MQVEEKKSKDILLQVGEMLTVEASSATGSIVRMPHPLNSGEPYSPVVYTGEKVEFGPFDTITLFRITATFGSITYNIGFANEDFVDRFESQRSLLATQIANENFPPVVKQITTSGFANNGIGAARYTRLTSAPSANEQAAGLNFWLFRSNGNTVWWRLDEQSPDASMYGAVGDAVLTWSAPSGNATGTQVVTGTDDTVAIQAAANHAVYFSNKHNEIRLLGQRLYRVTDTIHLGYGDLLKSWTISSTVGHGMYYYTTATRQGIVFTQNDRPLFNTQGGRRVQLRNLCLIGPNALWLYNNYNSITDRRSKSVWRGPQAANSGTSTVRRHAPGCAIAIDGYSGNKPAVAYPDVTFPSWVALSTQYGKAFTSQVSFENVQVVGFEVGIAIQPNAQIAAGSNGDFVGFDDCSIEYCETAVVIAHSDAREIATNRTMLHFCHTGFDGLDYGGGVSNFAADLRNLSFDNIVRLFNVSLGTAQSGISQGFSQTIVMTNPYCEATYSLGTVRSAAGTNSTFPGAVTIVGGELNFFIKSGEYAPAYYLDGMGEVQLSLLDVSIGGIIGLFTVNCPVADARLSITSVQSANGIVANFAGRRTIGTAAGFWAPSCERAAIQPFLYYDVSGTAITNQRQRSHGWDFTSGGKIGSGATGGRGISIPWFVKSVAYRDNHVSIARPRKQTLDTSAYPITVSARNDDAGSISAIGRNWVFTVSDAWLTSRTDWNYCIGTGDIARSKVDNRLYYVTAVSSAANVLTITLRAISGINTSLAAESNFPATNDILEFMCCRVGVAGLTRRLMATVASAATTISPVAVGTQTFPQYEMGGNSQWTVNVGDYLLSGEDAADLDHSVFPEYTKITAVTAVSQAPTGPITVNKAARRAATMLMPALVHI